MADNKKTPNPVDVHVGARVRLRRTMLGVSQEKLGEHLGITFQQVQKYEKGANRIGASRLQKISEVLDAPVSFFFEDRQNGLPGGPAPLPEPSSDTAAGVLSSAESVQLARAFARIRDPKVRRRIVDLVRSVADSDGEDAENAEDA